MKNTFLILIFFVLSSTLVFSAPAKKKEKDDYVSLRISVRVNGQFTGNSKQISDDSSDIRNYQDSYTTSYKSVTKWKVIDLDQGDDVAALERVSDNPSVSGSGQGQMKSINKSKWYGPYVNGKRKEGWQTQSSSSSWTYEFPKDSKPFPAQIRLHKRAKTFRIELNAVGPDMPEAVGKTIMESHSPDYNDSKTLDRPMAFNLGGAMSTMSQIAAIPLDKTEKRLTGKFDPEKPFAVSGSAVFDASEVPMYKQMIDSLAASLGQGGSVKGNGSLYVSYTLAWNCEPEDIDAIIVPEGYESWLPEASTSGNDPGNTMVFDVKLVDKNTGKEPEEKTAFFQCDLSDVSKEPGSCMNSTSKGTEPDLKILAADNPDMETVTADGQSATSKKKLKSGALSVSCYDGAAYGRLKVEAHLDDGRVVLAHMEGKSGGMDVTIPYDDNNNKIADAWEDSKGVKGKSPSADDDEQPLGDHDNGDGLTIWEEYRGFVEDGNYFRTDPKKKDFFICDTIGGKCKRAIDRFKALTKLDVHDKLTVEELSESHVINRNHSGDAPHVVDQHGIIIVTWSTKGTCKAAGGPGTPKSITQVLIDSTLSETVTKKLGGGKTKTYEYYEPTVAHEILHCCNVWHHGQVDKEYCWQAETVGGSTDIYEYASEDDCGHPERGTKIQAFLETPVNRIYVATDPFWSTPTSVWLGKDQGQHSGNEDCVMRYDCSTAYTKDASSRYCLLMDFEEPVGEGLCTSPTGTGVNAAGRVPASRYGDAAADKGDCIDKFCVNDLYH